MISVWIANRGRLFLASGGCASEERMHRIGSRQTQRAAILGDRVLEPHFDREDVSWLSVRPNSGRAAPMDRVIATAVSTLGPSLRDLSERLCNLGT